MNERSGADLNHLDTHTLRNERDRLARLCDRYAKEIGSKYPSQAITWHTAAAEMDVLTKLIQDETKFLMELEKKAEHERQWTTHCIMAEKSIADLHSKYYRLVNDYHDYRKHVQKLTYSQQMLTRIVEEIHKRS